MAGTLFVVATPIGNLEDITMRALRVLREVSLIAAEDTRRTAHLLSRYGITTKTTSLHEHNERARSGGLVARLLAGESIAIVSDAGTPAISDPGATLVQEARSAGVRVEPIPGPSAITALLSVAGVELERFAFLGFPPTRSKDRKQWLESLASLQVPAVFYEAPHRIVQTLTDVMNSVGDIKVLVGRELTKAHETLANGPISVVLASVEPRGEFVIMAFLANRPNIDMTPVAPSDSEIAAELGVLTENKTMSRRMAISAIAKRHHLSAKVVYSAVERHKQSVMKS